MKRGRYGMERLPLFNPKYQHCFIEEKRRKKEQSGNRHIKTGECTLGDKGGIRVEKMFYFPFSVNCEKQTCKYYAIL